MSDEEDLKIGEPGTFQAMTALPSDKEVVNAVFFIDGVLHISKIQRSESSTTGWSYQFLWDVTPLAFNWATPF